MARSVLTIGQAVDAADELTSWLEEMRRQPFMTHEGERCASEALRTARALKRWIDKRWDSKPRARFR